MAERWFSTPNIYYLLARSLVTARCLDNLAGDPKERNALPFVGAVLLFLLGFLGLVISAMPYLVPPDLTIWDVSGSSSSQLFLLVGTLVLFPLVIGYTVFVYWMFRGKVSPGEGYH